MVDHDPLCIHFRDRCEAALEIKDGVVGAASDSFGDVLDFYLDDFAWDRGGGSLDWLAGARYDFV